MVIEKNVGCLVRLVYMIFLRDVKDIFFLVELGVIGLKVF